MISPHLAHPNPTSQRKILLPTLSPYLHHHQNLTKLLEEKIQHLSYTILTLEDQLSVCERGLGQITCALGINVDDGELTLVDKFALITQELVKVKTQSRVEIQEKEAQPIYITKQIEVEKPVYITRQIEVEKPVYVLRDAEPIYITRQVQVERPVYIREEVEVEKQKVVYITKEVEVQIEKPIYITKLIEIQKPIYITEQVQVQKPTYINKQVYIHTPVYIDRVVEKPIIVERTIEKQTVCEKCQKIDALRDSVCVA